MNCPRCENEMKKMSLKDAIAKGFVKIAQGKDDFQWMYDNLIENSDYAYCENCKLVMVPTKES